MSRKYDSVLEREKEIKGNELQKIYYHEGGKINKKWGKKTNQKEKKNALPKREERERERERERELKHILMIKWCNKENERMLENMRN